ncbi:MAG: sugar phosphate isomerase/epimerase [Bacteroidia bacterium]|nr:sugar phosphate isomerase/epimerase [Bacteroidia bacterium]
MKNIFVLSILLLIASCGNKENEKKANKNKENSNIEKRMGGLALYTVRDDMSKDPKATLRAVAEAGYVNIEAAGYENGLFYGMSPEAFKNELNQLGLVPISSHQSSVSLENADKMMADVKAAGFEYFVVPIPPMGLFNYDNSTNTMSMTGGAKNLAQILDTLGIKANATGLKLLYHNHDFEFMKDSEGIVPIDYLLENCNPDYVNFQMDLFWVTKAGANPVSYFTNYPDRFKMWHVKDMDDEGKFAPVGKGNIDFKRILGEKERSGMRYYMVEQDQTFEITPLEAIKISQHGIRNIGFQ